MFFIKKNVEWLNLTINYDMNPLKYSSGDFFKRYNNLESEIALDRLTPTQAELLPLRALFEMKHQKYSTFPLSHFFDFPKNMLNEYINGFLSNQITDSSSELFSLCMSYFKAAVTNSGLNISAKTHFNFRKFMSHHQNNSLYFFKLKILFITKLFTTRSLLKKAVLNHYVIELYEKLICIYNQPESLEINIPSQIEYDLNISILNHLCSPVTPFLPESEKTKKTNYLCAHLPGTDYKKIITSLALYFIFGEYKTINPDEMKLSLEELDEITSKFMKSHEFYIISICTKILSGQPIIVPENHALIDNLFDKNAPVSSNIILNAQTYLSLFNLHLDSNNFLRDHQNNILGTGFPFNININFIGHLRLISVQSPWLFDNITYKNRAKSELIISFEKDPSHLSILPNNIKELTDLLVQNSTNHTIFSEYGLSRETIQYLLARAPLYDFDLIESIRSIAKTKKIKVNQAYEFEHFKRLFRNILNMHEYIFEQDIINWSKEALQLYSTENRIFSDGFLLPLPNNQKKLSILSNALLHIFSLPQPIEEKIDFIFFNLSEELLILGLKNLKSSRFNYDDNAENQALLQALFLAAAKYNQRNLLIALFNSFDDFLRPNPFVVQQIINVLIAKKNFKAIYQIIEKTRTQRLLPWFNLIFDSLKKDFSKSKYLTPSTLNTILSKFLQTVIPLPAYVPYLDLLKLNLTCINIKKIEFLSFREKLSDLLEICLYQSFLTCDLKSILLLSQNGIKLQHSNQYYLSMGLSILDDDLVDRLILPLTHLKKPIIANELIGLYKKSLDSFFEISQKDIQVHLGSKIILFSNEFASKKEGSLRDSLKKSTDLIFKKEHVPDVLSLQEALHNQERSYIDRLVFLGISKQLSRSLMPASSLGVPVSLRSMLIDHLILRYKSDIPIINKEKILFEVAIQYQDPVLFECAITLPEIDLRQIKLFNEDQFLLGHLIQNPTSQNRSFLNKVICAFESNNYSTDEVLTHLYEPDGNSLNILDYCGFDDRDFTALHKIILLCQVKKINPLDFLINIIEQEKAKGPLNFSLNFFHAFFKESYNFIKLPSSKETLQRVDHSLNNLLFECIEPESPIEFETTDQIIKIILDKIELIHTTQKSIRTLIM